MGQVGKFEKFRKKMLSSLALGRARGERGALVFSRNKTPEDLVQIRDYLKERIIFQGASTSLVPGDETFADLSNAQMQSLQDNYDRDVIVCWNPPAAGAVAGSSLERAREAAARWDAIRDTRIGMLMPKLLAWAFEGRHDTLKTHAAELGMAVSLGERQEAAVHAGGKGSDAGGGGDAVACTNPGLVLSGQCLCGVAAAVVLCLEALNTKGSDNPVVARAVAAMEAAAKAVDALGPVMSNGMVVDGSGANSEGVLMLDPRCLRAAGRFLRVDACFVGMLLNAVHLHLPQDILKSAAKSGKKNKKSKKNKKNKKKGGGGGTGGAGGGNGGKATGPEAIRLAIVGVARSLHGVLAGMQEQLDKCSESKAAETALHVFGLWSGAGAEGGDGDGDNAYLAAVSRLPGAKTVMPSTAANLVKSLNVGTARRVAELVADRMHLVDRLPGVAKR